MSRRQIETQRRRVHGVVIAALALTALGLTAVTLDHDQAWAPLAASSLAALPECDIADDLSWVYVDDAPVDAPGTTAFASNAMIVACPWSAGTLTFTLRGTLGRGVGTRVVLVQGPAHLLDVELRDERRSFEIEVPSTGQVLLAFVNDYYQPPEDRNLWVSGLAFTPRSP